MKEFVNRLAAMFSLFVMLGSAKLLLADIYGSVGGLVRDQSGAIVADASVTLSNPDPACAGPLRATTQDYEFLSVRLERTIQSR